MNNKKNFFNGTPFIHKKENININSQNFENIFKNSFNESDDFIKTSKIFHRETKP